MTWWQRYVNHNEVLLQTLPPGYHCDVMKPIVIPHIMSWGQRVLKDCALCLCQHRFDTVDWCVFCLCEMCFWIVTTNNSLVILPGDIGHWKMKWRAVKRTIVWAGCLMSLHIYTWTLYPIKWKRRERNVLPRNWKYIHSAVQKQEP